MFIVTRNGKHCLLQILPGPIYSKWLARWPDDNWGTDRAGGVVGGGVGVRVVVVARLSAAGGGRCALPPASSERHPTGKSHLGPATEITESKVLPTS